MKDKIKKMKQHSKNYSEDKIFDAYELLYKKKFKFIKKFLELKDKQDILNKQEELELDETSPNVTYQAKGGRKSGKLGKSSIYSIRGKDESKKDFRKSHVKDIKDEKLMQLLEKSDYIMSNRITDYYILSK